MTFGGCETGGPLLTGVLVRALRDGAAALPDDIHRLNADLKLIAELLAEKASESEPTWTLAAASGAEVETLQKLERLVALKAASLEAARLPDVLAKLAMWEALGAGGEDDDTDARDRLVGSVRCDLEAMIRATSAEGRNASG